MNEHPACDPTEVVWLPHDQIVGVARGADDTVR